jgi:hypothetical protein
MNAQYIVTRPPTPEGLPPKEQPSLTLLIHIGYNQYVLCTFKIHDLTNTRLAQEVSNFRHAGNARTKLLLVSYRISCAKKGIWITHIVNAAAFGQTFYELKNVCASVDDAGRLFGESLAGAGATVNTGLEDGWSGESGAGEGCDEGDGGEMHVDDCCLVMS